MPLSQYISSITIVLSHVNWEWRPITFVILAVAGKKKIPHLAGFRELPRNQRGNPKSQAPNPRQIPICKSEIQNELAKARINLATTFVHYRRGGARPRPKETQMRKAEQESVASSKESLGKSSESWILTTDYCLPVSRVSFLRLLRHCRASQCQEEEGFSQ